MKISDVVIKQVLYLHQTSDVSALGLSHITLKIKVELSSSKDNSLICFNENPLKTMKNAFYFILKALFILLFKGLSVAKNCLRPETPSLINSSMMEAVII